MHNLKYILIAAVLISATVSGADEFKQSTLKQAHDRLAPAMGVLGFSTEFTNPQNGETNKRDGTALALVVSPGGLLMTHGHMILDNTDPFNITVSLGEGEQEKKYTVVALPKPDDINVVFLQIESEERLNLPYIRFTQANTLDFGAPVAVFGILTESLDFTKALWSARVGAVLDKPRMTYCLDGPVRFGYIGGPAVDTQGQVVGVIGFDLTPAEGGDLYVRSGHPLVYQTSLFQKYIQNPPSAENVVEKDDAWLGVFSQPLTEDLAEYWGLDREGGLIVSTVVPGSPASEAGFQSGDIIIDFAGTPIRAKQDREVLGFTKLVRETGAGADVKVKLLRNGEPMELDLKLGTRPRTSQDADQYEDEIFGLTVREITRDVRIALNLNEDVQGVIVRKVRSGSTAQLARMQPGVIIMNFGDTPVTSLEEFKAAVERVAQARLKEVPVFARVGAATGFFRLQPRWAEE